MPPLARLVSTAIAGPLGLSTPTAGPACPPRLATRALTGNRPAIGRRRPGALLALALAFSGTAPAQADPAVTLTAEAGQVTRLSPLPGNATGKADITTVEILDRPDHGQISVNPDLSLSLVLSEDPQDQRPLRLRWRVGFADGHSKEVATQVTLTPARQAAGWGMGRFAMLATDRDGRLVVEHGDVHRKLYVSPRGMDAASIARGEALPVKAITPQWLIQHPEYGGTAERALTPDIAMPLWFALTTLGDKRASHWLLFERGQDYPDVVRLIMRGANGEGPLHPLRVAAYGEGAAPRIGGGLKIYQEPSSHVVIQDLHLRSGATSLGGSDLILDRMLLTGEGLNIQNTPRFTLRDSAVRDVIRDAPVKEMDRWHPSLNRIEGIFVASSEGVLIDGALFDHTGWREGYDPDLSAARPMPPSYYSQNIYVADSNRDVTLRDTISMRAASFGAQIRPGGMVVGNLFIDNNAGLSTLGGNYQDAGPVGNASLLLGNVITSAGHKRVSEKEGALSWGIDDKAIGTALVDNIVAHLANPDDPAERAARDVVQAAQQPGIDPVFDNTIIANWGEPSPERTDTATGRREDRNVAGRDADRIRRTTIQRVAGRILGRESLPIADLATALAARIPPAGLVEPHLDAAALRRGFAEGFGLPVTARPAPVAAPITARFVPDPRADGLRWDNPLNWDAGDLPGRHPGDRADLGGNAVWLGGQTLHLAALTLGDHGRLTVSSGRLDLDTPIGLGPSGGDLAVEGAGQVWLAGHDGPTTLRLRQTDGRIAHRGALRGPVEWQVGGRGQALLALPDGRAEFGAGSTLTLTDEARAGFDGDRAAPAVAILSPGSTLRFVAGPTGLGALGEFRSGAWEGAPQVLSGLRLDGRVTVDLSAVRLPSDPLTIPLIGVDQIVGRPEEVRVDGLPPDRDALFRLDYTRDQLVLLIGPAGKGKGQVRLTDTGDARFTAHSKARDLAALWAALQ